MGRIAHAWTNAPEEVPSRSATGLIVVLMASGVAGAQTWQVADVYSSEPISAGGPSTSLTLTAEADVRRGETGHRGRSVLLSYGCNTFIQRFPRTPVLDTDERSEDVLLVIAPGETVLGSYAVDGRTVETNSQWAVTAGAEEFATIAVPTSGSSSTP